MSTQVMPKVVKQNPIKSALTMIASVAAVVVFFWTVEDRYVSAADFQNFQNQQQRFVDQIQKQQRDSLSSFRRQMLEDELFELELKVQQGTATNVEKAKINRIKRQLLLLK